MDAKNQKPESAVALTADVISAYVSNNHVQADDLVRLITEVHAAITAIGRGQKAPDPARKPTPAEIRRSIGRDVLISFEDGKPYKTLRRHLTMRGLTPESYRRKWGLPLDYPMTSASYSEQRSQLARTLGLGQQRRRRRTDAAAPDGEG
ncbi:MucR family transcriptional regulator [Methylobacterium nodulans]|uniref:Transcriptional regulator, MucR family n=1 Tax=Methylobacterium nodulans (strain LMG 21967 / CNCM I-2342 / ORS 2060) TaxID=460265 RepID=B8IKS6_METNO|nr:MucR family transcriptional regulator [Methylobacterium nodulans]ACL56283.1 transcriptional regulator, MucR family [Methylobacterium nodulans ORS 2060]